jgi:hypothetical protein
LSKGRPTLPASVQPQISPARALSDEVNAAWTEGSELIVKTNVRDQPGWALVAIRRREWSCVIQIPVKQYDGLALAHLMGFLPAPTTSAMERAKKELSNV